MKSMTLVGIVEVALVMAAVTDANAQGSVSVSNLQYPTVGSYSIGSDSWVATWFQTGQSSGGYLLDSIQLSMGATSGNPSGLRVMIWDFAGDQSIADLAGPDPVGGGIYSYAANGFTMAPHTVYWFVVTAETPLSSGAFEWNYKSPGYLVANDWTFGGDYNLSSDGLEWIRTGGVFGSFQFAVNATVVPEPAPLTLLGLGGLCLGMTAFKRRVTRSWSIERSGRQG